MTACSKMTIMKLRLACSIIVFTLTACGQSAVPADLPDSATLTSSATLTAIPPTLTPVPASTEASAATPTTAPAVATSRGPELEATDPAGVVLASGELHFVEFFRFT